MEIVGAATPRELAAALGMTKIDDERRVRAWVNGDSAPNFYGTMKLLEEARLIKDTPGSRPVEPAGRDPILEAVQALDRKLDVEVIPKLDDIATQRREGSRTS